LKSNVKLLKTDAVTGKVSEIDVNHAEISRDGLRAVDSGVFTFTSKLDINIGDEIKYIQDVANTKHLRGAYLFQGTVLDESGYNVDPVDQTHSTISGYTNYEGLDYSLNTIPNHKFRGMYEGTVLSSGKGAILENKLQEDGTTPVHDFSGDFEIYAWVTTPSSGTAGVIYSKTDINDVGITLKLNKSGSNFYPSFDFKNNSGGSSKNVSTYGVKNITYNSTALIRIQRVGNDFNLYMVDGTENTPFSSVDGNYPYNPSYPHSAGSFNVPSQATIGSDASSWSVNSVIGTANKFGGELHQLRIYCGGNLDHQSASQIFSSRPIPLIMKLAGTIWKIESNLDEKKVFVKGFGKVITDTLVSETLLTTGTTTGEWYSGSGARILTAFTNVSSQEVVRAIIAKLNTKLSGTQTFKLSVIDTTGTSANINTYTAEGNFLEIINQLMMIGTGNANPTSFYISPRGKCIIEVKDIDMTNTLTFKHGKYQISQDGFDDTSTVNDLYVSSRAGGSFGIVHADNTVSINKIGLYSRRILTPQLTDAAAVTIFKDNFIGEFNSINTRYTIQCPFLLDFIRENFQVKVINSIKSLDKSSTIKSITWTYPESRTIIETGDFLLDGFDLEKVSADTINNIITDTNLNP
jgi:hypothetical protein